jgi:hypothetical protein
MLVPCQQFVQKAKRLILQQSDKPVVFLDLSLAMSLLSIESKEGGGDQQVTPKLLIEAFSAKSAQFIQPKHRKEPYNIALETSKRGM